MDQIAKSFRPIGSLQVPLNFKSSMIKLHARPRGSRPWAFLMQHSIFTSSQKYHANIAMSSAFLVKFGMADINQSHPAFINSLFATLKGAAKGMQYMEFIWNSPNIWNSRHFWLHLTSKVLGIIPEKFPVAVKGRMKRTECGPNDRQPCQPRQPQPIRHPEKDLLCLGYQRTNQRWWVRVSLGWAIPMQAIGWFGIVHLHETYTTWIRKKKRQDFTGEISIW